MPRFQLNPDIPAHRLRALIDPLVQGQCKILSLGPACTCPLCDLDKLYDALRWYEGEAVAIHKNMIAKHDMAVLASVNVLSLDNGKRSLDVLGPVYESTCASAGPEAEHSARTSET